MAELPGFGSNPVGSSRRLDADAEKPLNGFAVFFVSNVNERMTCRVKARVVSIWAALALNCPWAATAGGAGSADGHWAFQAPRRPGLPVVKDSSWLRAPLDAFVLARLEREDIRPAPEADRTTLIRRLYLDLTGLLPAPNAVDAFLSDSRPEAYERLVDSLLASPHFGERWGRHWLDLARYADSSGYQIDRPRPYAYVFRDWVIDSFNRDLPFDQFTIQQIAGDLLPGEAAELKIATGFHRNTLMNHEDGTDAEEFRCKAKVDRVSTTGTAWLGLTVGCAECHDHKYDPISQREFFQLYAFFDRTEERDIDLPQPKGGKAQAFAELSDPPRTQIHIRGDFLRRGDEVQPGVPGVLHPFQAARDQANRLDLARWIADPANPLIARVAVNRFWRHLFGRGLVNTPEDFGVRGEKPSHPELLDWLATEFVRVGWSRKSIIKLMVMSATYRQAADTRADLQERDPLNVLCARQARLRVESEIVRDLCLSAGGLLNAAIGGPSFRPYMQEDIKKLGSAGGFEWTDSDGADKYRRGLYIFGQRTVPYPASMTFDQANSSESCARRELSTTPLQALTLLNHPIFVECAVGLGLRMRREQVSTRERLEYGFRLCLGRRPATIELDRLQQLFDQALHLAETSPEAVRTLLVQSKVPQPDLAEAAALVTVAQVLLNLDEFITRE